jgi:hypothetical protein
MLDLRGGDPESQIPCWPPSTYGGIRRMLCMFLLCELSACAGCAARWGARQNRQPHILVSNSKQQVDDFVRELTL